MSDTAFAQHILSSIRNELNLLKTHNYIQPHAYDEILRLLPTNVGTTPNMGGYSSNPPAFSGGAIPTGGAMPTGGMPVPSPTHSTTNAPAPPSYNNSANENKLGNAEALYDYSGDNMITDLSFRRGDIIQLTELGKFLLFFFLA